MGHADGPACQRRGKAGPLAFYIDEEIDRAKRQEVLLAKFDCRVVDHSDCRSVSLDRGSGARQLKPWPRRTIVNRSANQGVTLINVISLRTRQEGSSLVEPVGPSEIGLLQVVVPVFEAAAIDGIYTSVEGIIVALRNPAQHKQTARLRGSVPGRDVRSRVYAE